MIWLEVFLITLSYVVVGWGAIAIYWMVTRKAKTTKFSIDIENGHKHEPVPSEIVDTIAANRILERSSYMTDDEIAAVIVASYKKAGLSEDEISRRMLGDV